MKAKLFIDTSHIQEISVALEYGGKRYERKLPSRIARAQTVLPLTEELLKETGLSVHDIGEIVVSEGKESYTGVRVGFAIANTLGKLLGIPVNGKKALAFPKEQPLHYKRTHL